MAAENKVFAERFKQLRIKGGYTQQEIANRFNVTRPCICYWENGNRVPDFYKIIEICKFFNVTSDYLFGTTDNLRPKFMEDKIYYQGDSRIDLSRLTEESIKSLQDYYEFLLYRQNH